MSVKKPIPALDGVRFLAAMLVVAAHAASMWMERFGHVEWLSPVKTFSALGMSLFFVLSGFVIHYNYRSITHEKGAMRRFAVARFARLYPLYVLVVLTGVVIGGHWRQMEPVQLISFLTLTQSWFYTTVNGQALVNSLGGLAAVTWSISTEVFFYVAYVCGIAHLLGKLTNSRHIIGAAFLCWAVWMGMYAYFAAVLPVEGHEEFSDSLQRWVVYFTPYMRLAEFFCGACAAQYYISGKASRGGVCMAALLVVLVHTGVYVVPALAMTVGGALYGPLVAWFLLLLAQQEQGVLTRFFAHPAMRGLGHASYSIYLLHGIFLWAGLMAIARFDMGIASAGVLFAVIAALLLGAVISYRLLEVPARRFLRTTLLAKR